jgi:hypothetical protein
MMVVQAGDSPNKRLDSGRTASYSCDSTRWTFRVTFADHIALAANAATICTAIVAVVRWALLKTLVLHACVLCTRGWSGYRFGLCGG